MKTKVRSLLGSAILSLALVASADAMDDDYATECGSCQFPTAVSLALCSGVYVGHGMVLTAAHCVGDVNEGTSRAYFGEESGGQDLSAVIDHCVKHPDGESSQTVFGEDDYDGVDLAFCILQDYESLPDIPVVPPMVPTGCERDWLAHQVYETGQKPTVTAVGSGCADYYNGGTYCADGIKRYIALQLVGQVGHAGTFTKLELERWGELDTGLMQGDSGGPVFDVLPDGTWRLLGVHHGTNVALKAAFFEAVPPYLHWIEAESGIDITPCHDFVNGDWVVSGSCAGELPKDTNEAGESWANACPSDLGGGVVGINGICSGWPVSPGDKAVAPSSSGLVLPNDLFLTAAGKFVFKAGARRERAQNKIIAKMSPLAVFPFLADELPDTMSFALLEDSATLRAVKKTLKAKP